MLDCACGTGDVSILLGKKGFQVDAFDSSEDMLMIAKEKSHNSGLHINYTIQDLRQFKFHKTYSLITCINDGVNYLTNLKDAEKFFKNCYSYLNDKGYFLFDVSTAHKMEKMSNQLFAEEDEDFAYIWFNDYDKGNKLLTMDLSFYTLTANGLFARSSETHVQRAHSFDEITLLLKNCGFNLIAVYSDLTFDAPADSSDRIHFFAQKA